jgi:hypothetical protein
MGRGVHAGTDKVPTSQSVGDVEVCRTERSGREKLLPNGHNIILNIPPLLFNLASTSTFQYPT